MRLGIALLRLDRHDEAVTALMHALALAPGNPNCLLNLGQALAQRGDVQEARAQFMTLLQAQPEHPDAMFNLGVLSLNEERLIEARDWFERAIARAPEYADAYVNLGIVMQQSGNLSQAVSLLRRAISLAPSSTHAHFNLGQALAAEGQTREAAQCYEAALTADLGNAEARMALAMSKIPPVCETPEEAERAHAAFAAALDDLERWFASNPQGDDFRAVGVLQPFLLAYQERNNRDLLQRYGTVCANIMTKWLARQGISPLPKRPPDGTVRVGIVSRYFWTHPVWDAILKGWLQEIDQTRYPLFAFCLETKQDDETCFAECHAAAFVRGPLNLEGWVRAIIDHQIDVLVYPEIGMDALTLQLASLRLAPVQAATWGHPDTTGLPTIDYYLSAAGFEPPNAQGNYCEKLVELTHLGCFYDPAPVTAVASDLSTWGIEDGMPILLCPGVPFKYAPQHDSVFVVIARALKRCRFFFFRHRLTHLTEAVTKRLEQRFMSAGLRFADFVSVIPWQDPAHFHGLLQQSDVFLDTIGFSGFNTAMQAVRCGIPVVTYEGRYMRGRLASGILRRIGLDELVATSDDDYVARVIRLTRDIEYRMQIGARLQQSRHVLFADVAPIRALEKFLSDTTDRQNSREDTHGS
jgi:predicted O-linked N-acetylglucosamine transferase (SPINDLY family)